MTINSVGESTKRLSEELRKISIFADLTEEHLAWLVAHSREVHIEPGEVFAREGDPVEYLTVILEGEIRLERDNMPGGPTFTAGAGRVTGLLPYSRLTHFSGTGRAVLPTRVLQLHKDHFSEMLRLMPQLGQRLVSLMADRIRETTASEQQRDKLMALGKLSAGLAHELNNPAAAAGRAAASLREALETVRDASLRLLRHSLTPDQREFIANFEREAAQRRPSAATDPLAQSDREDRVTSWLEACNVQDAWKIAPTLAEAGVDVEQLEGLAAQVESTALGDALTRIVSLLTIGRLVAEIENSTKRISDLVRAIKQYSYMDQAPIQEVDIHEGFENTLTIFGHRLKEGVNVVRDYDKDLPRVCAYGGELNQIWTNLIDNALDAMGGKGELRIRTRLELDNVVVEIGDNGPGIPADIQSKIFEPFFTTKGVSEGTGLGLDTVCRIVRTHHGSIRVESKPGDTRFLVHLPLKQPRMQ